MITIIDNDVILKLGKWDLISELIGITDGEETIYHLPTCPYVLCPPAHPAKALKRCGDQATIDRVTAFCKMTNPAPEPENFKWLEILNGVPGIDVGEVQIFTMGIENPESVDFIGDKRSLLALATSPSALGAFEALKGRVKCLEQVVAEMICTCNYGTIAEKVKSCPSADKAISLVFGTSAFQKPENEISEGLLSYYSYLNDKTLGLLAPFPTAPSITSGVLRTGPEVLLIS